MRYAVIRGGIVTEILEPEEGEELVPPDHGTSDEGMIVAMPGHTEVAPGWRFSMGSWLAPADLDPVPEIVSRRQLKLALLDAELLDDVEGFVAAADRAVQISWADATEFQRSDPMLNAMVEAFPLPPGRVDEIFRAAAAL